MTGRRLPLTLAWICLSASAALASVRPELLQRAPAQDPDWPCIQRKVPELSVAAVWSGPPIEEALTRWRDDAEIAALVEQLVPRRVPLEEATAAVARFAQGLAPDAKAERLTLLFAGLFQTLDRERGEVMAGIGRYARKQRDMAEQIRRDMGHASDPAAANAEDAAELQNRLLWQTRIFNERRASLTFVCEVPTIIEQRLFALARAIAGEMPS